jgi:FdhD protein
MNEAPVWLAINGVRRIMLVCSPLRLDALAAGHLLAEAWVEDIGEITSLREVAGPGGAHGVEVGIPAERVAAAESLRRHRIEHGCGLRHILDCGPSVRRVRDEAPPPDLGGAFRTLFAAADAAAGGGVHAAAFCDADGSLGSASIDVARHCAIDRAIGRAGLDAADTLRGLVITSRISGAIALKAVHAGVPYVASRSIATPLAREIAAAGGVRLLEQAARRP